MKVLAVTLLSLLAVSSGRHINQEDVLDLEDITSYGYLTKIGLPLAEKIRQAEEEGVQDPTRIVGGSSSTNGQFPYQAGLLIDMGRSQGICGGSLVSNRRVLTAAHCWFDGENQGRSITVVLGSTRLTTGGTRLFTTSITMHGNWNPRQVRNDIAIINLPSNITPSGTIAPIPLPSGSQLNEDFVGVRAIASGFGAPTDSSSYSLFLRHIEVSVITNALCRNTFGSVIQSTNLCTSGAFGRSPCEGDSGGPLAVTRNNRRFLIGVAAFGSSESCSRGLPYAFTRVTSYISWINSRL